MRSKRKMAQEEAARESFSQEPHVAADDAADNSKSGKKSKSIIELQAATDSLEFFSPGPIIPLAPLVLTKQARIVSRGASSINELNWSRLSQKKMRTLVQIEDVEGLNEYEKLRALNIKKNAMMMQKMGIPTIEEANQRKKGKVAADKKEGKEVVEEVKKGKQKAVEKQKGKGVAEDNKSAEAAEKEKLKDLATVVAVTEPSAGADFYCWSCNEKFPSLAFLFCCYCGVKQIGVSTRVGLQEEDAIDGNKEPVHDVAPLCGIPEMPPRDVQIPAVFNISDSMLTYERVFHPRPRRLAQEHLWGKIFLKKFYPRQHEKLNLNHGDVRSWFSDNNDPFVKDFIQHPSIRHDTTFMQKLTEFVKAREPELATLVFVKEGVTMRWKMEDIMKYAIEIKHYRRKQM